MINMRRALRRAVAWGILAAIVLVPYVLLIQPMLDGYRSNEAEIVEARTLLDRFNGLGAATSSLHSRLDELRERVAAQQYFLSEGTDALAAAELQERIKAVVQESDGVLRSVQTMPAVNEGDFRRVAIRVQAVMTMATLLNAIHAVETEQPLTFVDNIDIQARTTQSGAAAVQDEPQLFVTFDLLGYLPPG